MKTMFCSNCGHELKNGTNFCSHCGAKSNKPTKNSELKYSCLYRTDSGEDIFEMKTPCIEEDHKFVAYISHKAECVATRPTVTFKCRKCGKMYFGSYPYRYGNVVAEEEI